MIVNLFSLLREILLESKEEEPSLENNGKGKKKQGPPVPPKINNRKRFVLYIAFAVSIYGNWIAIQKIGSLTFNLVELRADVRDKDEWEERAKAYERINKDLLEVMKKYLSSEREVIQNLENSNKKMEKLHNATKKIERKVEEIDKNK